MKSYYIITYGCQMNINDSERIAAFLNPKDYKKAESLKKADLLVVNSCSVRQKAVDRIFGLHPKIEKLKQKNPNFKAILTGCILPSDRKKMLKIFDKILPIKTLPNWNLEKKEEFSQIEFEKEIQKYPNYLDIIPNYHSPLSASIPISAGCDNFCSYCVVPYARGTEICRNWKDIIKEAKNLAENGYKEIWLLGQNVNSYNFKGMDFPALLKKVAEISGNFWIRFTSPHPKDFSDKLIKIMASSKKITPYLNLPLQSGDDKILEKMKRDYTAKDYFLLVEKIRKAIPHITLSTDVIAGFPGESKKQFNNTKKIFKKIGYDMAYIARYSPRPNTSASRLKNDVPRKEKKRREKILNKILEKSALKNNKKFIGKEVLFLPASKKGEFTFGKTYHYKTIKVKGDIVKSDFNKAKVIKAEKWRLLAKIK